MTPGVRRAALTSRRSDRLFYTGMAAAIAAIVLVGFAPTYYLRPRFTTGSLPLYVHVHGLLFTAWIALLLVQTTLVARGRISWHRALGVAGAMLAALVIATGATTGIFTARREAAFDLEGARAFLTIPLSSMLVFSGLVSAAIVLRERPQAHKRLMLLATISVLDAPIARWPGAPGSSGVTALVGLVICAGILYDIASRGRVHAVYLWGGPLVVGSQILRGPVGRSGAWQAVAALLIG
jgi:hypothetical protein